MSEQKINNRLSKLYEKEYEKSRQSLEVFTNPTKKKLLTIAIDLFAKDGYQNVSMRDLAEAAGIKAASIYNHFKSKYDILIEIFDIQEKMQYFFVNWNFGNEFSAKEILFCIFEYTVIFAPEEVELFRKVIRIVVMEQYREPKAYETFTHYMLIESSKKYKSLFDKLIAEKRMKPFDTACFSQIFVNSLYSYVIESSHYHDHAYPDPENIPSFFETKKFLYDIIYEYIIPEQQSV